MKNFQIKSGLFLLFSLLTISSSSVEAKISSFSMVSDDGKVTLSWGDPAEESIGYALQWAKRQADVHHDKAPREYYKKDIKSVSKLLRAFEDGEDYFIRIYGYKKNGDQSYLTEGSKIIKFKLDDGVLTQSDIEPTDTEVTKQHTVKEGTLLAEIKFGKISATAYDNFADINWASPSLKVTKKSIDKIEIVLTDDNTMKKELLVIEPEFKNSKIRVVGLTPGTRYYVRGYYVKNGKRQSEGRITNFKTLAKIDLDSVSRASRTIKRLQKQVLKMIDIDGNLISKFPGTVSKTAPKKTKKRRRGRRMVAAPPIRHGSWKKKVVTRRQNNPTRTSVSSAPKVNNEESLEKQVADLRHDLLALIKRLEVLKSKIK